MNDGDRPPGSFSIVPDAVARDPALSSSALRVWLVLNSYANKEGECYPGMGRLTKDTGLSRGTLWRAVSDLRERGLIEVDVRRQTNESNTYRILSPRRATATTHVAPPRLPTSRVRDDPRRAGGTNHVAPVEHELEVINQTQLTIETPAPNGAKKSRQRDELFEALAEACQIPVAELTPSGRGALNAALKQIRDVHATPAQVTLRAHRWPEHFPGATLTPTALAKHWALLGNGRRADRTDESWMDRSTGGP